ncbi:MAG: hypothetical protein KJO29_06540 [Bacteroidia bacterium]|nr:hypothetical protein [Bacteroidia bacterium]
MKLFYLYIFCSLPLLSISQNGIIRFEAGSHQIEQDANQYVDCKYKTNAISKGTHVVEFESKPLFVYTHPQVRKLLKGDHLMETEAHIYKAGDNIFLVLDIIINSENARMTYGDLDQGARLKIGFVNSQNLYLENIERDRGLVDRNRKTTSYQGVFRISKSKFKDLRKSNILTMGLFWEEGYEEYEIINVDLIKNQLNCLN